MSKIRVLLVDDHALLRAGLRALLSSQPDLEVVGETGSGREVPQCVSQSQPDVVLLDLTMPDIGGLEAIANTLREHPHTRILVLTMHEDERYLHAALKAGASGYIVKRAADSELASAIRAVARGEIFVHSTMTRSLVDGALRLRSDPPMDNTARLSEREEEVLKLIALGYTYEQIGERLVVSPKTVATYKARIIEKLGVEGRNGLVRYAMEQGWLDPLDAALG